jgi:NAD-dependent SIR2 family protein deacetylase
MDEMQECHEVMHGCLGSTEWSAPACVTYFDQNARLTFTSIKAHEYEDRPHVLQAKIRHLAQMIRQASNCMALTGAGISTAAGIDDYATKGRDQSVVAVGRPQVKDWKDATPTRAHRVMAAMYKVGLLKHWLQQNHDSLPQKAGFPQHALNEIHGSLHDPANPIVPYEGTLRDDLYDWMKEWEEKNDLCLALGTSLSGFNVDSVAESAARRSQAGQSLGLVIVNLQHTQYDAHCSLRIYAKIDDVMELLAAELGISNVVRPMDAKYEPDLAENSIVADDVLSVPFDADGNLSSDKTVWDLREGKQVKLTGGPYEGDIGTIMGKNVHGDYRIRFVDSINPVFNAKRRPFSLWMGNWWLEQASKGLGICPGGKLPFVNVTESLKQPEDEAVRQVPVSVPSRRPACAPNPPPLPSHFTKKKTGYAS